MSAGYLEVIAKIQTLSSAEQALLLEYLSSFVSGEQLPPARRSLLELEGLGKGTWTGIDAQEYVRQERDSWMDRTVVRRVGRGGHRAVHLLG